MDPITELNRIRNRQLAKFMEHLERKDILSDELRDDIKRFVNFTFGDIRLMLEQCKKERANENNSKTE